MDVIYCFDENYKELFNKSKESILKHNPQAKIHTIRKDINNELKEFTYELCGFKHVSKACFLRLLIPKYFPKLKKALYLDCDTVCLGSLEPLFNVDFENNYILATRGHLYSDIQAKQLGLPYYTCSGMMMFNISLMNKENYFKQIKDNWKGAIGKQEPFSADETIINWCFHDKIKLVNEKWNYCYKRDYGERACNNPVILHFPSSDKKDMDLWLKQ
ncbi:MAG: hypothetical protein MJ180_00220 [Candidatus Gastranaerophilales bacterium]|nr:hypothetical protein [Candidatus Gastranaerophilales bacterium]